MSSVQQWGRKESVIWPPRGYVYTLGAFIFACILTGAFIYIRFQFGLAPLQRYYLPYYVRTETAGMTHPVSQYQLLYVSDGEKAGRAALDADVQPGSTVQFGGKPLPLMLTPEASKHGEFFLMREGLRGYQNKPLHAWIAHWIYQDVPIYRLFTMQLVFGLSALALQIPFSIRKDIRRIKDLRYGRRLKGPVLVNGKQFTKAVAGTGIGITTDDSKSVSYTHLLPVTHDDLRRFLPECRPGRARFHDQSLLTCTDQREPAIPLQLLSRLDRGQ